MKKNGSWKRNSRLFLFLKKHGIFIVFGILLVSFLALRFYQLEERTTFHSIDVIVTKNEQESQLFSYINVYYHGFHFRKMLQLAPDAFIEFSSLIHVNQLGFLRFVLPLLFSVVWWFKSGKTSRERNALLVLIIFLGVNMIDGEIIEFSDGSPYSYYYYVDLHHQDKLLKP